MIASQNLALTAKEAVALSKLASNVVMEHTTNVSHYVCSGGTELHNFGVNRIKAIGLGAFREATALMWCDRLRTGTWVLSLETKDGRCGSYEMLIVAQPAMTALASARELVEVLSK